MKCRCCEAQNRDDSLYCQYCGSKLERPQNINYYQNPNVQRINPQTTYSQNYYYQNNTQVYNNTQKMKSKKKTSIVPLVLAITGFVVAMCIMFIVVMIPISKYVDIEIDFTNGYGNIINVNGNNSGKNKRNKTSIIDDNYYIQYVASEEEAYELLEKDSISQKTDNPEGITKIENDIINQLGIDTVNLKEMDEDFAQDLYEALLSLEKEYPSELDELNQLTLVNGPLFNAYMAYYMPANVLAYNTRETMPYVFRKKIALNSKYYLNREYFEKAMKTASSTGHFPDNANTKSLVIHEVGHFLSYKALLKEYNLKDSFYVDTAKEYSVVIDIIKDFSRGEFSHKMIKEAHQNYCSKNSYISEYEFRSSISEYALAKNENNEYIYDETIAEAFHDYYLNGEDAAEASKEIVKVLNKYLRK